MHLLKYSLIYLLFFITSCTGQNDKSPRENNQVKPAPIFDDLQLEGNEWMNKLYIHPHPEGSQPESNLKIGEYVREVFQDTKGNLWFGTLSKGVARFDGKSLTYFSREQGLGDNQINEI
ncbi:MAG: hypothetical protein ACJAVF_004364, partial [Paraglaciecola sp.]